MKKVLFLLIIFLSTNNIYAQKTWRAKLYVHFLDSANKIRTDTVWVGCDTAGGDGFQAGLDVFDTIGANYKILSHDSLVQVQYGTDCGNVKTNIKKFSYTPVSFDFYAMGKIVSLSWDTTDFIYDDSLNKYYLENASLISYNGYILGIDINTHFIVWRFNGKNYFNKDSIWAAEESPLFYCNRSFDLFRFRLYVRFSQSLKFEGLYWVDKEIDVSITPNPFNNYININVKTENKSDFYFYLYNSTGILLKKFFNKYNEYDSILKMDDVKEGLYILEIRDAENTFEIRKKIIKTSH